MIATHKLETAHREAAEGTFQAGLPSGTLPENPMFPLPNMAPCVHNTRTAENKEVTQPVQPGPGVGPQEGKAGSHQLHPLLREFRHIQCGKHTGHIHTPLRYTNPLDSAASLSH